MINNSKSPEEWDPIPCIPSTWDMSRTGDFILRPNAFLLHLGILKEIRTPCRPLKTAGQAGHASHRDPSLLDDVTLCSGIERLFFLLTWTFLDLPTAVDLKRPGELEALYFRAPSFSDTWDSFYCTFVQSPYKQIYKSICASRHSVLFCSVWEDGGEGSTDDIGFCSSVYSYLALFNAGDICSGEQFMANS